MPYLVDGHNLIPKIPGLELSEPDDEMQLIELLQDYCRVQRKQVEVFFDNAPVGQPRARKYGAVTARFARSGQTADDLIRLHLQRLGNSARNWTVVSSDGQVQVAARAFRAQVLTADAFARLLLESGQGGDEESTRPGDQSMSEDELDDWMALFGGDRHGKD